MTTKDAHEVLESAVADFIFEGGEPTALVGHNRLKLLELADALEKLGHLCQANQIREQASKMFYPAMPVEDEQPFPAA